MKKIGIVLSGGGVKGMAHIGLLQALKENGIEADIISGASAGALVGAFYAGGYGYEDILNFFKSTPLFNFSFYSASKPGILDSEKYQVYFRDYFPENDFAYLKKKLFITTTNMQTGEWELHSQGEITRPLLASASVPPIFAPVNINGCLHSDGGIMNNFPVDPLQTVCDHIIGSYISPPPPLGADKLNSSLKVLKRAYDLALYSASKQKARLCDYVFAPDALADIGFFDTKAIQKSYEIGYHTAHQKMDEIIASISSRQNVY